MRRKYAKDKAFTFIRKASPKAFYSPCFDWVQKRGMSAWLFFALWYWFEFLFINAKSFSGWSAEYIFYYVKLLR